MAALFMCKRSCGDRTARRVRRFTIKEIEPFLTVEYRRDTCDGGSFCAVLGVAIQRGNGTWGTHELSDEAEAGLSRRLHAAAEPIERLKNETLTLVKRRLVDALNRLRDHYGRIYVYPVAREKLPTAMDPPA
jgi:hypothetical protein